MTINLGVYSILVYIKIIWEKPPVERRGATATAGFSICWLRAKTWPLMHQPGLTDGYLAKAWTG